MLSAAMSSGDKQSRSSFTGPDAILSFAGFFLALLVTGPLLQQPIHVESVRWLNPHPVRLETDPNRPPLCYAAGERLRLRSEEHTSEL